MDGWKDERLVEELKVALFLCSSQNFIKNKCPYYAANNVVAAPCRSSFSVALHILSTRGLHRCVVSCRVVRQRIDPWLSIPYS